MAGRDRAGVPHKLTVLSVVSTREILIVAANGEMASIEGFYPGLLARTSGERHADAIDAVQFVWASEKPCAAQPTTARR